MSERKFHMMVSQLTTEEFAQNIEKGTSMLSNNSRKLKTCTSTLQN
jgi:hypothetical protein